MLKTQGGFAITHVGKLKCSDGEAFSKEEAKEFLDIFSNFLSFARGFRVPVCLLVGYDANNNKTWEYWEPLRGDSWGGVNSWFPEQDAGILAVFPGFLKEVSQRHERRIEHLIGYSITGEADKLDLLSKMSLLEHRVLHLEQNQNNS